MTRPLENYLHGAATVLELWPSERNLEIRKQKSQQDDLEAIRRDWERVGYDLHRVIEQQVDAQGSD
jgi:hypothetical protein